MILIGYGVALEEREVLRDMSGLRLDPAQEASLPDAAFAWSDERRFPIHNREHVVILRPGNKGLILHTMFFSKIAKL
mgnify:CR=1 FL=1